MEKKDSKDNVSKISSLIGNVLEKQYLNTIKIKLTSNPYFRGYIRDHAGVNYIRKEYVVKVDNQTHRNTVTKLYIILRNLYLYPLQLPSNNKCNKCIKCIKLINCKG